MNLTKQEIKQKIKYHHVNMTGSDPEKKKNQGWLQREFDLI